MAAPDLGRNLYDMFTRMAAARAERPFLWAKRDGRYQSWSWQRAAREAALLGRALRARGLAPGDRVLLVAENRPEWPIADLAVLAAGGVTVPAYTTNTTDDHAYLLENSGARMAVVSTAKLAARLLPAVARSPAVELVISMEPLADAGETNRPVLAWDDALALGEAAPAPGDDPAATLRRDDIACLIYTSGTGGRPKGVMLSHGNILSNVAGAYEVLELLGLSDDEVFLSFLPLSHAYEHTAGLYFPIALGAQIYYAESVETLTTNLTEARPTIITCVPRLYEVMRQRILHAINRQGGLKPKLFMKAVELGSRAYEQPGSLGLAERCVNRLLDPLVRRKVAERFGGRMKAMVSGGAPLNYDVGLFFTALGLPLFQGYGQTECSPVISVNIPGKVRLRTVGPPLPGLDVRIAQDGEILVRGPAVMPGYWQDEATTAQTVREGWLHTGDIGHLDEAGYIEITDRKRDLIVNSGGDNIAPQRVEGILALEPEIGQVIVYGDRQPHLVALIVPDQDLLKAKAADSAGADETIRAAVGEAVKRANGKLSAIERVRKFALMPEPFSIENGMMTPTLKLKRQLIYKTHHDLIAGLYQGRG
jgi:long-chain acyl-CoA synthetase